MHWVFFSWILKKRTFADLLSFISMQFSPLWYLIQQTLGILSHWSLNSASKTQEDSWASLSFFMLALWPGNFLRSRLGSHRDYHICFTSHRSRYPSLPELQWIDNHSSIYWVQFLVFWSFFRFCCCCCFCFFFLFCCFCFCFFCIFKDHRRLDPEYWNGVPGIRVPDIWMEYLLRIEY